jgi:hypothetical protein
MAKRQHLGIEAPAGGCQLQRCAIEHLRHCSKEGESLFSRPHACLCHSGEPVDAGAPPPANFPMTLLFQGGQPKAARKGWLKPSLAIQEPP